MLELDKRAHTFTGQGSQMIGMWAGLEQSGEAQAIFNIADEVVGFRLSKLCKDGPLEELIKTSNAQPAIVAQSIAGLRTAQNLHPELLEIKPRFSLGHSVGEYSALVDAEVIDIATAIYLVRQRGLLMEQCGAEGKMAALIGFKHQEQVVAICRETGTEVANFNGPAQIVISGGVKEIEDAIKLAGENKIKAILLPVNRPFHSSLMKPMLQEFKKVIAPIEFKNPVTPVILNVTGRPSVSGTVIKRSLIEQPASPVRWDKSVNWALAHGADTFLEFGPKDTLTGLLKRIDIEAKGFCIKDYQSAQTLMIK